MIMEEEEEASSSRRRYVHETIKNIEIEVRNEYEDDDQEEFMVEDPIKETAVTIDITINRYTTQSSSSPETLDDTTTDFYFLEGFLDDGTPRLDELNSLVRDKTVIARTLKEIKKTILSHSSRIKEIALELKREGISIDLELDLLTWYSDHQDTDDHVSVDNAYDDETDEETGDEIIVDEDDDVRKPALRSSVEALETRRFEKKEDLELMLKSTSCGGGYRSCMVCLGEFLIDAAAAAEPGGISIKTMPCSHMFHSGCIERWLEKRYTCPICRYKMPTAD